MSISVADFPAEVIEQILLFAPTPRAVIRVGTTCSRLLELVSTNQRLWNRMYKRRWTVQDSNDAVYSLQHYRARHGRDEETLRQLQTVANIVSQKRNYGLGEEFLDAVWETMIRNVESFDTLRAVAKDDPVVKAIYSHIRVHAVGQCLATQLVDAVHFVGVFDRIYNALNGTSEGGMDGVDGLERGALLVTESLFTWQELLEESPTNRVRALRETLNDLGTQLQRKLDEHGSLSRMGPLGAVQKLGEVMNAEGNTDNYYDVKNSSLDHVLKNRKGIPLTLVILYKLILNRVGVDVDVIGLPGHVVLGLPGGETFVDIYGGGRVLSRDDCGEITRAHHVEWREEFLQPLSTKNVLLRMSMNIVYCIQRALQETGMEQFAMMAIVRSMILRNLFQGNLDAYPLNLVQQRLWNECPFMNPGIFRHFNLIDEGSSIEINGAILRGSIDRNWRNRGTRSETILR